MFTDNQGESYKWFFENKEEKKPTASKISFNSKRQENKRTQAHLEAEKYTTFYLSL